MIQGKSNIIVTYVLINARVLKHFAKYLSLHQLFRTQSAPLYSVLTTMVKLVCI